MDNITTQNEIIANYIISNLHHIQLMIKPYKLQRDALLAEEKGLWHLDINEQYKKIIRSVIAVDLALALQITPLDALIFCEEMNTDQL